MALTITATPAPASWAMDLSVTGAAGTFTIEAAPLGRDPYTVRVIGTPTAATASVRDHEAPFGIPIRYTVRDEFADIASVLSDGLDVRGCVLSSTMTPGSALPVTVTADRPHEWEARSAWFDVIGRRDPLVSVDVMRYRAGEWVFYAVGTDQRAALIRLLATGEPLLLRTSVPERIDDVIALPTRATEDPHLDERGGRLFTVRYQGVTRTLGPYAGLADWTYADLLAAHATYADLLAAFPTYSAVYAGPVPPPATRSAPPSWGVAC